MAFDFKVKIMGFDGETKEKCAIWLSLPLAPEKVKEQAGVDAHLGALAILEHTFPFDMGHALTLSELNFLTKRLGDFYHHDKRIPNLKAIADEWDLFVE